MLVTLTSSPLPLVGLPLAGAVLMLVLRQATLRYALLLLVSASHLLCSVALMLRFALPGQHGPMPEALNGLLRPDALGTLFLLLASALFLASSVYAVGYLRAESANTAPRRDFQDGTTFTNAPEQRFLCFLCIFLASMSFVTITPHLGALWVGIECTTLSSAPLIYFHRHRRSLEATWKYLMICSVGIALALLGNILFTLAYHPAEAGMDQVAFFMAKSAEALRAGAVPEPWLKAGFIFLLVGYGTKMGLAPLHSWLPDSMSQAPSLVAALDAALLNCAFLGILRGYQIMNAAGLAPFSGTLLVFFGLLSMLVAAIFIVDQGHFKRLLAYSSVEHAGIMALGVGLGGAAIFGSMLHSVSHAFTKCMLFLLAGNVISHYHTHSSYDARGLRWTMPITGALWMAGFLSITGSPPFGLFVSEFSILRVMLERGDWLTTALYLGSLGTIFVAMSVPVLRMVQGPKPPSITGPPFRETVWNVGPPLVLALLALTLGMYIPDWMTRFLRAAASVIEGGSHGI